MYIDRERILGFKLTWYSKFSDDLDKIESLIWDNLYQGKNNKKSDFHTPTLVTKRNEINPRTLILRDVNKNDLLITFFTDQRTNKKKDIDNNNTSSIHVYDKKKKIQVCFYGKANISQNNIISQQYWKKISNLSKLNYASKKNPGSKILSPSNVDFFKNEDKAYGNFAVINVKVYKILWLFLSKQGNRKAQFEYSKNKLKSLWLTP